MCGPQTIYMEVGIEFESIYLKDNLQPGPVRRSANQSNTQRWDCPTKDSDRISEWRLEGTHSIYGASHSYFRWYCFGTFVPQKILAISVNGTCATCGCTRDQFLPACVVLLLRLTSMANWQFALTSFTKDYLQRSS